jgi:GNAT superfamily N-acetyltransferase
MEDQELHPETTGEKNQSYSILEYPARELPKQYMPFIFSKWLRSLRHGNRLFKQIDSDEYYKNYSIYLDKLLQKPNSLIRLAVLTDNHDVTLGFAISREDVLDYLFVQREFRTIGIGTRLMPEGITTFTHLTLIAIDAWNTNPKLKHLKFNPFA